MTAVAPRERSHRDPHPAGPGDRQVVRATRMELLRLRSRRSTWWLAGGAVALSVVVGFGLVAVLDDFLATQDGPLPHREFVALLFTRTPFIPMVAGITGALLAGSDYSHRLLTTTLLVTPHRRTALGAKLVAAALWALGLMVVGVLATLIPALAGGVVTGGPEWWAATRLLLGYAVLVVGWAVAGVSLAVLFRSQTVAVAGVVLVPGLIEPVLRSMLDAVPGGWMSTVSEWLPFAAASAMTGTGTEGTVTLFQSPSAQLSPPLAALVFAGYVALLVMAAVRSHDRQGLP